MRIKAAESNGSQTRLLLPQEMRCCGFIVGWCGSGLIGKGHLKILDADVNKQIYEN